MENHNCASEGEPVKVECMNCHWVGEVPHNVGAACPRCGQIDRLSEVVDVPAVEGGESARASE